MYNVNAARVWQTVTASQKPCKLHPVRLDGNIAKSRGRSLKLKLSTEGFPKPQGIIGWTTTSQAVVYASENTKVCPLANSLLCSVHVGSGYKAAAEALETVLLMGKLTVAIQIENGGGVERQRKMKWWDIRNSVVLAEATAPVRGKDRIE